MANELQAIVFDLIKSSKDPEITIEKIFELCPDLDSERNYMGVIRALKALEETGAGVFAIGRRGRKSRFIKGAIRIKSKLDQAEVDLVKSFVEKLTDNQFIILNSNNELVLDNVVLYKTKDRTAMIEIFKMLESNGLGYFIIGRRGAQSRFAKTSAKANKNKVFIPNDKAPSKEEIKTEQVCRYNVINNVLFQCVGIDGGYNTVEEVMKVANIEDKFDVSYVKEHLSKFGYFSPAVELSNK